MTNNKNTTQKMKKGYKKTKLGWIPEEWEVKRLGDIGTFSKGKGITKKELVTDGLPCIRYGEIYTVHNNYITSFYSTINKKSADNSNPIFKDDILFSGSGETLEDIGKSVAFIDDFEAYAGGDIIILRNHNQNAKYLGYLLNTDVANRQTCKLGQGNSVVHIYSSGLKGLKIPLPPLPEQQKIAKILSTWDVAIDKLTQLIALKEKHKKGLMQVLLTAKVRFNGFTEEWKEVRLGEVADVKRGVGSQYITYVEKENLASIRLIRITDFLSNDAKHILKTEHTDRFLLKEGDLLIAGTGATAGITFEVPNEYSNLVFSYNAPRIRVKKEMLKGYLIYYLKSNLILRQQHALFTGNAQPFLDTAAISGFKLKAPLIKEQQKIATILSTADAGIEKLKAQLDTLKAQKKGLMQQLLTGKTRVKV